jgi:class 3 adenylate cyclase/tetratricopeptide (TPR) repeat protein
MQQITDWLKKLGMSEYAQRFVENRIDLSVLPDLTDQHLEKLGVALGDRLKILRAIRELCATTVAQPAPAAALVLQDSAERRQLTVMFCDLVGSTALSARLDPEDLREIIGAYHRCCAEQIVKSGGFVARYLGDGVLAYFGYPRAHEHDAERAVRAGLALVEAIPDLKTAAGAPLQARVGIATGLVVVGDLFSGGGSQEQTVVGETPNLAARLQTLAEPHSVVIAGTTRSLLGQLFEYRALGHASIKGFDRPTPIWQVIGTSAVDSRFEALRAMSTPLVGREEEIDLLMRRWQRAKNGEGSVVLILGEPGIGKSRLAETVRERLSSEPLTPLRCFCSPHHLDSALYPIIAQLQRAAGFRRDDVPEQRLDKLKALLAEEASVSKETIPLLADLLSIPTGDRYPLSNLTPQKRKERTLQALLGQLRGLARCRPVLMVLEDAHWIDPTSLELLDLVVDQIPSLATLLIVTFRPEFTPPWIGRPHVTLLSLSRLPRGQCADMITHLTGGKVLPKEVIDQIVDRTDGVPLFIEELTKAVVESGIVTETSEGYVVSAMAMPSAIPTSLHASLLARLDRLNPTREIAQIAAALGRQFSHELISAVAQIPSQKVDDALAQLVGAELIFQRGIPPDAEYTFKHALVQDTAYGTLLLSRRQQLHARIVSTLENQFPDIVAAQPQLLAQHCAKADLQERAIGYWLTAGEQAIAQSAMTEAVAQLQKGMDLLVRLPDGDGRQQVELDFRRVIGPALVATRGYADSSVGENIARARVLAEQLNKTEYLVPLLYGQFALHLARAEHKLALSHAERMEQIGDIGSSSGTVRLLGKCFRGYALHFLGEFPAARALLEQCQGLNDPAHRTVYAAFASEDSHTQMLATLAVTLIYLGYIAQGLARVKEALLEVRRLGHPHSLALVLTWACWAECIGGSSQEAKRHADEMATLSNEHGFLFWSAWALIFDGHLLSAFGQAQESLPLLSKGISIHRATGAGINTPLALVLLAEAYAKFGRVEDGLNCLAEAMRLIETTHERIVAADLNRLRGDLLHAIGDQSAAEQSFHQALAVARKQGAKLWEVRAATSLARLWRNQSKRIEARDLLAPIYGWFTEGLDTPDLKEAKVLLDELT